MMWINILNLFLLLLLLCYLVQSKHQKFLVIFLLVLTLAPPFRFGEIYISISYACCFYPLVWVFKLSRVKITKFNSVTQFFLFTGLFLLFLFICAWVINGKLNASACIPLLGYIHILFITIFLILYIEYYKNEPLNVNFLFDQFIGYLIIFNTFAVFLQAFFPLTSTPFFYELYWEPSLTAYTVQYDLLLRLGYNPRMFGLYGTPLSLGVSMLLALSYYSSKLLYKVEYKRVFITLLGLLAGIASLSKSFLIGLPAILVILISNGLLLRINTKILKKIVVIIIFFPLIILGIYQLLLHTPLSSYATYYFNFILHPLESLTARYTANSEDLFLLETYKVIFANPIIGVGPGQVASEFIGDSQYVTILHNSGFVGLSIYMTFLVTSLFILFRRRYFLSFLLLFALIITGLGVNNIFLNVTYIPFTIILLNYKHTALSKIVPNATTTFSI